MPTQCAFGSPTADRRSNHRRSRARSLCILIACLAEAVAAAEHRHVDTRQYVFVSAGQDATISREATIQRRVHVEGLIRLESRNPSTDVSEAPASPDTVHYELRTSVASTQLILQLSRWSDCSIRSSDSESIVALCKSPAPLSGSLIVELGREAHRLSVPINSEGAVVPGRAIADHYWPNQDSGIVSVGSARFEDRTIPIGITTEQLTALRETLPAAARPEKSRSSSQRSSARTSDELSPDDQSAVAVAGQNGGVQSDDETARDRLHPCEGRNLSQFVLSLQYGHIDARRAMNCTLRAPYIRVINATHDGWLAVDVGLGSMSAALQTSEPLMNGSLLTRRSVRFRGFRTFDMTDGTSARVPTFQLLRR